MWAFTGIAAILTLTGVLEGQSILVGVLWLAGFVIWVLGPFMLIQIRSADRVLKDWKGNYLAYSHIMSFELSPRENQDLTQDIVRNLMEIRAIKHGIERLGKKPPHDVEYSVEVEGKRGTYKFDAVISTPVEIGFVRVFPDESRKVGVEDVRTLAQQVEDVIKKQKTMDILEVVAVSRGGFTEEAINYASSSENWIGSKPHLDAVNLIHATPEGYSITWMQYPRST